MLSPKAPAARTQHAPHPRHKPRGAAEVIEPWSFSLLTPTRIPPPVEYQAPPRAKDSFSPPTEESKVKEMFQKLKGKSRSELPDYKLSAKADYLLLSRATQRGGDVRKGAIAYYNLGVSHDNAKNFKKGIEAYKQFLRACRSLGDDIGEGLAYNTLAMSYHLLGDLQAALNYHAKHAKLAKDARSKVVALCNAGLLHRQLKNIDLAIECHNSAVEIAVASRDKSLEMLACGQLGLDLNALTPEQRSQLSSEQLSQGQVALERQLSLQSPYDDPKNSIVAYEQLGLLAHARGRYVEAANHFDTARKLSKEMGDTTHSDAEKCNIAISLASQNFEGFLATLGGEGSRPGEGKAYKSEERKDAR